MKSWKQFCENFGGLPQQVPDYSKSGRFGGPATGAGGPNYSNHDLGQVHLHIVGNALHIDANNNSVRLTLTPQQLQQLMSELS